MSENKTAGVACSSSSFSCQFHSLELFSFHLFFHFVSLQIFELACFLPIVEKLSQMNKSNISVDEEEYQPPKMSPKISSTMLQMGPAAEQLQG